jgi:hypothetical protein
LHMFNFFRSAQPPRHLSPGIAHALAGTNLPAGVDATTLSMVERRGSYSGRRVKYFRIYDPARATERDLSVRTFADLDTHLDLVLGTGHTEQDGGVVLTRR